MDGQLTANDMPRDAGVTLIELMVVVAIMAVLVVGVSIAVIRPDPASMANDQQRFQRSFDHNRTLAVHSGQSRGLNVGPRGLTPVLRTQRGWDAQNSPHRWRGRVALVAQRPQTAALGQPDIVFLSTGQTSAFDISFAAGQNRTIRCRTDGWTGLQCGDL